MSNKTELKVICEKYLKDIDLNSMKIKEDGVSYYMLHSRISPEQIGEICECLLKYIKEVKDDVITKSKD